MEIAQHRRLKIGELARLTGLSINTIRYYERRGQLEQPPRTEGCPIKCSANTNPDRKGRR